jgi:hypothetical protein
MDKPAIRDVMLRQAFQLAYFIQGDRELAIRITTAAMSKLNAAVIAQNKRLYYKLSRRSWLPGSKSISSRTKVSLSELHLLQRLVYLESEPYERQKERPNYFGANSEIDEESLIRHYIKHLVSITLMRNSFHVTLGVGRLLYNYTAAESMELYDLIMQNPERAKNDAYWRERKARLMKELKDRFGQLLAVVSGPRGEERFQAREDSAQYLGLVRQCLQMFMPWDTPCPLPGTGPVNKEIEAFTFRGSDPDEEHQIEIVRIHTVIHPDCFERSVNGLGLDAPARRLEIPQFFHSSGDSPKDKPRGDRNPVAELSEDELARMRKELDDESTGHKKASISRLRILVDGDERARLELNQTSEVSFEVEEGARLIEVRTASEDGDLLLAVHALSYDDMQPTAEPSYFSITRAGGQKISLTISPVHRLREKEGAPVRGVSVVVSYEKAHLLPAWLGVYSQGGWPRQRWGGAGVWRYARAATIVAVSLLSVAWLLIVREQPSQQKQIAGSKEPVPSVSVVASSSPDGAQPRATIPPMIQTPRTMTPAPAAATPMINTNPERLRGEAGRAATSLLEMKKICIEVIGDHPVDQSIVDHLSRSLRMSQRWTTAAHDEADAWLRVAGSLSGREISIWIVDQTGQILWPRTDSIRGRQYKVTEEEAGKVIADLVADVRELRRRR